MVRLQKVKDSIFSLQVAFGTGFNEGLKDALDATNNFLPQLEQRFADAGNMIGMAMTESIQGNHEKFILIGETVGTIISAGIHAAIITGLDNLGPVIYDKLFNIVNGANKLTSGGVMDFSRYKGSIASATGLDKSQTNFGEQMTNAMDSYGANALLQKVNIALEIAKGVKTGIDTSMSRAVREGVLEAQSRQPGGAKFSN